MLFNEISLFSGKQRDLAEQHKYAIPLSKHMLYVFSSPLLIVDSILTWRWPSTAETGRHRRTNKLRYLDSCVLTDLATLISIKHNGSDKPEDSASMSATAVCSLQINTILEYLMLKQPLQWNEQVKGKAVPLQALGRLLGRLKVEGPRIFIQSTQEDCKVASLTNRPPLPSSRYLW